jgi:hypothetical protein
MPRTCTICNHSNREPIERALLAGDSFRNIAKRTGTSIAALYRHRQDHILPSLAKTHEAQELARSGSLVDQVREQGSQLRTLWTSALEILEEARVGRKVNGVTAVDPKTALSAINAGVSVLREGRSYFELIAKITGQLNPPTGRTSFGPINQLQFKIVMPKTPEADRIEREALNNMTAEQQANFLNSVIGHGLISPATHDKIIEILANTDGENEEPTNGEQIGCG